MANRNDNTKKAACTEWEMLLAEALDGVLTPEQELSFNAHMTTCAECAEEYEQARRGREWLGFLAAEPEVPEGLLERILISTGPGATQFNGLTPAMVGGVIQMPPVWQRPNFMARATRYASQHFDTRILMTAAMAFFSIALTLNLSGFRLDRIHMGWITPNYVRSIMERRVTAASTPLVRYYDHVRDSYEVDSKVRVIKKTTESLSGPIKSQMDEDRAEPEQQMNQAAPDQAAPNQVAPSQEPTRSTTPDDQSAPKTDQQKQSEPKVPGRQGAGVQLPEQREIKSAAIDTNGKQERQNHSQEFANLVLEQNLSTYTQAGI